jgi:hypothetical protein
MLQFTLIQRSGHSPATRCGSPHENSEKNAECPQSLVAASPCCRLLIDAVTFAGADKIVFFA